MTPIFYRGMVCVYTQAIDCTVHIYIHMHALTHILHKHLLANILQGVDCTDTMCADTTTGV